MKSLLGKLGAILIGVIIFGNAEVWGADWKVYAATGDGISFYDTKSITRVSSNIVRVWEKTVYTKKGRIPFVKKLGESYENLVYQLSLYEFNCVEKKLHVLQTTSYTEKNEVIFDDYKGPTDWKFFVPGSIGEAFYEEVCK